MSEMCMVLPSNNNVVCLLDKEFFVVFQDVPEEVDEGAFIFGFGIKG